MPPKKTASLTATPEPAIRDTRQSKRKADTEAPVRTKAVRTTRGRTPVATADTLAETPLVTSDAPAESPMSISDAPSDNVATIDGANATETLD